MFYKTDRILLNKKDLNNLNSFSEDMLSELLDEDQYKDYIYSRGYYDKVFFYNWFLEGYSFLLENKKLKVPKHWLEIWDLLDKWVDFNIIEPRGHWKTTAVLIRCLWALLYWKERRLLYVASSDLWLIWIWKIRGELETNENIMEIFWILVPKNSDDQKDKKLKRWKQKELELLNWTSMFTLTVWQRVRWQRPSKILFDDPQEEKDVQNPKTVSKFNRWVLGSLYNTLMPGSSMVVLWTIISTICLVKYLRDEKTWPTIQREACTENYENVLWPEMWPAKELKKRKEWYKTQDPITWEIIWKQWLGTALFNQEYRNIPITLEDALIKECWLRSYDTRPEKFDYIVMAVDPKSSLKQKWDEVGICIVWIKIIEWEKRYWVIYSKWVLLSPNNTQDLIEALYNKYKPDIIFKEDNIEKGITESLFKKWLPVKPITASTSKWSRLLSIAWLVELGYVYFRPGELDEKLTYQLTSFPDVNHDDVMDAFVWCLIWAKEFKGRKKLHKIWK